MIGHRVNVAVYFDRSYAAHAATMVRSLLDSAGPDCDVNLYVLGVDLTPEVVAEARASWLDDRLTVHWIAVDLTPYRRQFAGANYPPAAYARVLIDRLLPEDVARVITLDCDGLVLGDVADLWQRPPAHGCVSAAVDLTVLRLGNDRSPFARPLDGCSDDRYFNSGAMVIDLDRWRELEVTTRCLDLVHRHPAGAVYADQSLLNVVLQGEWERLPLRWNCNAFSIAECRFPSFQGHFVETSEVDDARRRPGFVHFVGRQKPWSTGSYHPHAALYWEYRGRTRWALPDPGAHPAMGRRARGWYRRAMFPVDRYRRVQRQAEIHHLPRRRTADIVHLASSMLTERKPWRATLT